MQNSVAKSGSQPSRRHPGLRPCVEEALDEYFAHLEGEPACGQLYYVVLAEVEQALLERALREAGENQRRAAQLLGLNRNTLRKKIRAYGLRGETS